MQISDKKVASIHYTLKNDKNETLDSSAGSEPLVYLQGFGNVVPGLENALAGKKAGDTFDVTVAPEEAYGPIQSELVQEVPRDAFDGVEEVSVGMRFEAQTASGPISVEVVAVEEDQVTVDGNHPLAGETLHFNIDVVEVREATEEELEHGHVHGPGCNH
ncbi:peptidylprolyl isomerase [Motiliproteus sp. MSK22-1]|uniref:peptidylprolyl isomerase n=1 Tax=Motiliproteus sp. MSK22-1 TaxID=1897630 RepID=UPI000977E54F|nr:peptidylprolyl isomerase [Motiliproteus sp. MSK22-1]OMH30263.1 peptidylprolyl isomerase [Motiliproteus sp. MSK22-1]